MPKTTGVVETVLYVDDLDRAAEWYRRIFALPVIFEQPDRLQALRVEGGRVLLLFRAGASTAPQALAGGVIPSHDGSGPSHLAFGMKTEDVDEWEDLLRLNGVGIEGRMDWGSRGKSLYFRDPDNHLVELITANFWLNLE